MFWSKKKKLPSSLVEEAKKHPNGYVYEFDSRFHPEGAIPNYAIKGAWPVGGNGVISGEFEPNPHYSEERIVKLLKLAAKNPNKKSLILIIDWMEKRTFQSSRFAAIGQLTRMVKSEKLTIQIRNLIKKSLLHTLSLVRASINLQYRKGS